MAMATAGFPDSTFLREDRLIPALSAISSADRFLQTFEVFPVAFSYATGQNGAN